MLSVTVLPTVTSTSEHNIADINLTEAGLFVCIQLIYNYIYSMQNYTVHFVYCNSQLQSVKAQVVAPHHGWACSTHKIAQNLFILSSF